MKKGLKKAIDQTVKNAFIDYIKYTTTVIVGCFLMLHLALNIIASQRFPQLYFLVVDGRENAMVAFLQKIYKTPLFGQFFFLDQNANGRLIQEVRKDEVTRENRIVALQQALLLNPQDRDILLAISRLYAENGDKTKAVEYLKQAQQIDPALNNIK